MIVFHGSDHIVERPVLNGDKRSKDYGSGFYTTENLELAKEWACAKNSDGFANRYELDLTGLSILNLNAPGSYLVALFFSYCFPAFSGKIPRSVYIEELLQAKRVSY